MGLQSDRISGKMGLQSERIGGKMGLASGNIYLGSLSSRRFHDRIKKDENDHQNGAAAETGSRCWTKLRFLGCISQRSKVEGSISDSNSQNEENKSSKEVSIEHPPDIPVTTIISSSSTTTSWSSLVPSKINTFFWKANRCKLPTKSNLCRRGISLTSLVCPFCLTCEEDESHILLLCSFSYHIWGMIIKWLMQSDIIPLDWNSFCHFIPNGVRNRNSSWLWNVIKRAGSWCIWWARNQLIFQSKVPEADAIFKDIQMFSFTWINGRSRRLQGDWNTWLLEPLAAFTELEHAENMC